MLLRVFFSSVTHAIDRFLLFVERNYKFALFVILILGTALRLYHLDYQPLWLDELNSVFVADPSKNLNFVVDYLSEKDAPLHKILLHFVYQVSDYNEYNGRLFSAICGVLGILSIYFLGKLILSKQAGIFCALFTSINYFHIFCSQELSCFSLVFLLAVLSYLFFIRALKSGKWKHFLFYSVFTSLLMYTHYFGILIVIIQCLTVISFCIMKSGVRQYILRWLIVFLLLTLFLLPWIKSITNELGVITYWVAYPHPNFFLTIYFQYSNYDLFTSYIVLFLLFLPFYFFGVKKIHESKIISKIDFLMLGLWLVLGYSIPYIYSIIDKSILYPRYTMAILPAVFIMVTLGIILFKTRIMQFSIVIIMLTSTFFYLFIKSEYYSKIRYPEVEKAIVAVAENHDGKSKIFNMRGKWLNFYSHKLNLNISIEEPDKNNFKNDIENEQNIWLITTPGNAQALSDTDQEVVDLLFETEKEYKYFSAHAVLLKRKSL